jgi:hypothetical protein
MCACGQRPRRNRREWLAGQGVSTGSQPPPSPAFLVIEKLTSDYALNVFFDDLRKEFWFAPELIELIDYGAGATITFDGVPKNMGAHGGGRLG